MSLNSKDKKKEPKRNSMNCNNEDWLSASMNIIENVKKAMKQQNIHLKDMAKSLGISQARVSQILNGKSNLTLKTICAIEQVLQVKVVDIPLCNGMGYLRNRRICENEPKNNLSKKNDCKDKEI